MSKLYGIFDKTLYRMSTKVNKKPRCVDAFKSSTLVVETPTDKSITTMVHINSMDFYKEEANEVLYEKILNFIDKSNVTGINTLFYGYKIELNYNIYDDQGNLLDGGIRYIQANAEDVFVLLNMDPLTFALPYRRAMCVEKKFVINKIGSSTYGVMDERPDKILFKINSIRILANFVNSGMTQDVITLGESVQDMTFAYNSSTVVDINKNTVVLFDTQGKVTFPTQQINYLPNTIYVDFVGLLNNFCDVANDAEIWKRVEANSGVTTVVTKCECAECSDFVPVVNRPPCHGNYPMPPLKKECKCDETCKVCNPTTDEVAETPLVPDTDWDQETDVVPEPDYNQDHGDINEDEWCLAESYEEGDEIYTVVADDTSDEEFDATTMVKYSEVQPFITDVTIGAKVKKELVMYE